MKTTKGEYTPHAQTWIRQDGVRVTLSKCGPIETYTTTTQNPWSVKVETFLRLTPPQK